MLYRLLAANKVLRRRSNSRSNEGLRSVERSAPHRRLAANKVLRRRSNSRSNEELRSVARSALYRLLAANKVLRRRSNSRSNEELRSVARSALYRLLAANKVLRRRSNSRSNEGLRSVARSVLDRLVPSKHKGLRRRNRRCNNRSRCNEDRRRNSSNPAPGSVRKVPTRSVSSHASSAGASGFSQRMMSVLFRPSSRRKLWPIGPGIATSGIRASIISGNFSPHIH